MQRKTATQERLSDLDRDALERAIATDRARNAACRAQIKEKLRTEPWLEVARFAARSCQSNALHLAPWECWPPCAVEIDDVDEPGYAHRGISKSAALLRRMLSLGISRWHSDPLAAIEAAEAARVS
jgi:hypothetical protein